MSIRAIATLRPFSFRPGPTVLHHSLVIVVAVSLFCGAAMTPTALAAAPACENGSCRSHECTKCKKIDPQCRAGCPEQISCLAKPSESPGNIYYWIGGGAPTWTGESRYLHEGTWGRDYAGHWFSSRVWLNWWHGQRAQGGTGKYQTDGPHFLEHKH